MVGAAAVAAAAAVEFGVVVEFEFGAAVVFGARVAVEPDGDAAVVDAEGGADVEVGVDAVESGGDVAVDVPSADVAAVPAPVVATAVRVTISIVADGAALVGVSPPEPRAVAFTVVPSSAVVPAPQPARTTTAARTSAVVGVILTVFGSHVSPTGVKRCGDRSRVRRRPPELPAARPEPS